MGIRNAKDTARLQSYIAKINQQPKIHAGLLEIILDLSEIRCRQEPYGLKLENDLLFDKKIDDISGITQTELSYITQTIRPEPLFESIRVLFLARESSKLVMHVKTSTNNGERKLRMQDFCIRFIRSHSQCFFLDAHSHCSGARLIYDFTSYSGYLVDSEWTKLWIRNPGIDLPFSPLLPLQKTSLSRKKASFVGST